MYAVQVEQPVRGEGQRPRFTDVERRAREPFGLAAGGVQQTELRHVSPEGVTGHGRPSRVLHAVQSRPDSFTTSHVTKSRKSTTTHAMTVAPMMGMTSTPSPKTQV